jgi:hypothetical protein
MRYKVWKIVRKVTEDVFASSNVTGDNELSYLLGKTTTTGNESPIFVYWDKDEALYDYGMYDRNPNVEYLLLEGYSTKRPIRIRTWTRHLYWPVLDLMGMARGDIESFWKSCHAGTPPAITNPLLVENVMWGVEDFLPERVVDYDEEW